MRQSFPFITVLVFSFWFVSCQKQVNPTQLKILGEDQKKADFSPSNTEMILKREDLVSLVVYKSKNLTLEKLNFIRSVITKEFINHGNIYFIPEKRIEEKLKTSEYRNFNPKNVADAIQLGKDFSATYVAQLEVSIIKNSKFKGVDRFVANINIAVFTTGSSQNVVKKNIEIDTAKSSSVKEVTKLVQRYFPLKGYIIESRANHQVAKITLGKSLGIKAGRELLIRNRIVKGGIVGKDNSKGFFIKTISFSEPIASVEVIKVMENESWVFIKKEDRSKIRLGQVVFTQPVKTGLF